MKMKCKKIKTWKILENSLEMTILHVHYEHKMNNF